MRLDRLRAQEERRAGFFVRRTLSDDQGDLELRRRQLIGCERITATDRFTGCADLMSCTVGPGLGAELFERRECRAEVLPRLGPAARPAQPLAEAELGACALEGCRRQRMDCEGLFEVGFEVAIRGEEAAAARRGREGPAALRATGLVLEGRELALSVRAIAHADVRLDQVRSPLDHGGLS